MQSQPTATYYASSLLTASVQKSSYLRDSDGALIFEAELSYAGDWIATCSNSSRNPERTHVRGLDESDTILQQIADRDFGGDIDDLLTMLVCETYERFGLPA